MKTSSAMQNGVSLVRLIKRRVALVVTAVLAFFLFSSEFVNAVFNNRLDDLGIPLGARVVFAFKPTVVALFVVFCAILYALVIWYLKPLLQHIAAEDQEYSSARKAANRIPWVIIVFQLVAWTVGTTTYYALLQFNAESGIPFAFGLPLKIAVGLPAAIYTSIILNIILIPAKKMLGITAMDSSDTDRFSRNRDYFAIGAVVVFITVNFSYIAYYYTNAAVSPDFLNLYLPLVLLSLFYASVSFGLIALSKWEYFLQIETVDTVLADMAAGRTRHDQRIGIVNFNELGTIAAHVNTILDNFTELLQRISATAGQLNQSAQELSAASRQNAAYSSEQASSTAEIVSTMEDVNALAVELAKQVDQVESASVAVRQRVEDGSRLTARTITQVEEVTESHTATIGSVRNLGEYIGGIWEIVKIINGIAGQIKIIAFNAALEASSAGEAGRNFEIVASEIRRLADNTVASTNEIRTRISDIQNASDELIGTTTRDSDRITEMGRMSRELESVFGTILESTETSTEATSRMATGVQQQTQAFEQVLITTRQIAEAVHAFSDSIESATNTADTLETMVETLNQVVRQSDGGTE